MLEGAGDMGLVNKKKEKYKKALTSTIIVDRIARLNKTKR